MDAKSKLKAMLEARKNANQQTNQEVQSPISDNSKKDIETSAPEKEVLLESSVVIPDRKAEEQQTEVSSNSDVQEVSREIAVASQNGQAKDQSNESNRSHPVFEMIEQLKLAQDNNLPNFHTQLRDIHLFMAKDPEVVTILPDEEIGIIVAGLKKVQGDVQLAAPKGSTKKRAPVEADML